MNPDDLLPTVTAIVGYDIYPHYLVTKGKLLPGGKVKTDCGTYAADSILRILPESDYEQYEATRRKVSSEYREKERQLRVDILKQNGVNFLPVK
ncbi:hypothetical protein POP15_059 [Pectobacterium phage POP15]|nr:hypothetical protein POP15_059 [Pectobacterium phage POP15]